MLENEYEKVVDEIVKHGVAVTVNKVVDDNYITNERKYVGCVVKLDFSEHDKVFEDKINDLEQRIRELIKEKDEFKKKANDLGFDNLSKQDENKSLKNRIAELETDLKGKERPIKTEIDTSTPLDCANSLIHHLTHLDAFLIAPERDVQTFTVDDLEQIAEHLLVYCKHNRESEE